MKTSELCELWDRLLCVNDFTETDRSMNSLVVDNGNRPVHKVAFAVDACLATIEKAAEEGADVLFVHHGLFWGKPLALTGTHYKRIEALLKNSMALYACHLPLDAHPELGNNIVIAKKLGLSEIRPFAPYKGKYLGYAGKFSKPMTCEEVAKVLGFDRYTVNAGGKELNETVGIVSGSDAGDLHTAVSENLDLFLTGENSHGIYAECMESKTNYLAGGHYNTETFGVKAVMDWTEKNCKTAVCFIDNPTDL